MITTCQILNQNFNNVPDFVLENFKNQIFDKYPHSKSRLLTEFTP